MQSYGVVSASITVLQRSARGKSQRALSLLCQTFCKLLVKPPGQPGGRSIFIGSQRGFTGAVLAQGSVILIALDQALYRQPMDLLETRINLQYSIGILETGPELRVVEIKVRHFQQCV